MEQNIDKVLDYLSTWVQKRNLKIVKGVIKKGGHVQDASKLYPSFLVDLTQEIQDVTPPTITDFKRQ